MFGPNKYTNLCASNSGIYTQAQKARWKESIHVAAVLFIPRDITRESQGSSGQVSGQMLLLVGSVA